MGECDTNSTIGEMKGLVDLGGYTTTKLESHVVDSNENCETMYWTVDTNRQRSVRDNERLH